jgi:pseudouridylate synthase
MEVETVVRDNGVVLVTMAILEGVPHVGISSEQLKRLATSGRQFQQTLGGILHMWLHLVAIVQQ